VEITYIGHATILIKVGETTLLTDPNFDPALGRWLRRVSAPGVAIADLPSIDGILLTHAHADHLSFRSLDALPRVPVYAPPAVARWIQRKGVPHAVPIEPGETVEVGGVRISAELATHAGNRYGVDRWRRQANMYLIDTNEGSVFFAGDTALTDETTALVEREVLESGRTLDVALLPIGYAPRWKVGFRRGHLTSADALTLFERLGARYLIPYHWGTFNHVTSTAFDAIREMRRHVQTHRRGMDVRIIEPGESFHLPSLAGVTAP
jgi:L-ascorbate metabolism protein UlaG (beta-lactamase superfamily)